MADRYLLESGAPDGYLLEDGSGVLLLETPAEDQPVAVYGDDLEEQESSILDWVEGIPTAVIAAVTTGILALTLGYAEPAPAEELESYVAQIYEAPATVTTNEAEVAFVVGEGIEPEDIEPSIYEPLALAEYITPAPAETDAAYSVDFPDLDDEEPLAEAFVGGTFENPTAATNEAEVAAVVTESWEDDPLEESVTPYFFDNVEPPLLVEFPGPEEDEPPADAVIAYLIEDAATADLTQIPDPVLTDPEDPDELPEAVVAFLFEDAPETPEPDAVLVLDFPDEEEPPQDIEAAFAFVFEDAAPPDLTFVPGWQDDFLRDYEQQREDEAEFALVGMVFDPFGQVDDPPPPSGVPDEWLIRTRRRGRR